MMSKNSSSTDVINKQKILGRQRIWLIAATALSLCLYYPLMAILMITGSRSLSLSLGYSSQQTISGCITEVSKLAGYRQNGIILVMILAVIIAITEFSYVFNRVRIDFYDSQPVSRKKRFSELYINGLLIFVFSYVAAMILMLIAAALLNSVSGILLLEIVMETIRVMIFFLAVYSISIAAVMLSGTLPVAIIMSAFLLFAEYLFSYAFYEYGVLFFKTISVNYVKARAVLSPVYYAFSTVSNAAVYGGYNVPLSSHILQKMAVPAIAGDVITLIIAIAVSYAAAALFIRRKSENAGKTVIYKAARCIVKIAIATGIALYSGMMIYTFYSGRSSETPQNAMLVVIILTAVAAAGLIEAFYNYNIKCALKHAGSMIASVGIVLVIFVIFSRDITGYDSYVPAAGDISSYVINFNMGETYYDPEMKSGIDPMNYYKENMFLKDIDDIRTIAADSAEHVKKVPKDLYTGCYSATVMYRLKNGRKVYRELFIPYSIDKAMMDRIVGSEEYRKGYFQIYDEVMPEESLKSGKISYSTAEGTQYGAGSLYNGFLEAYRKDVEKYNFSRISTELTAGRIDFQDYNDDRNVYMSYNIYPEDVNTISFLKKNNLYLEVAPKASTVKSVTVTNFYPGYDVSGGDELPDTETGIDSKQQTYTDPDKIKVILDAAIPYTSITSWIPSDQYSSKYSIDIYTGSGNVMTSFTFRIGEEPDFVKADTDKK